jgi:hypothetical protein
MMNHQKVYLNIRYIGDYEVSFLYPDFFGGGCGGGSGGA